MLCRLARPPAAPLCSQQHSLSSTGPKARAAVILRSIAAVSRLVALPKMHLRVRKVAARVAVPV